MNREFVVRTQLCNQYCGTHQVNHSIFFETATAAQLVCSSCKGAAPTAHYGDVPADSVNP
jgi:hypothetical protein